jgi:hypothetical protein
VPVSYFCCFWVSEKLHMKYSRNWTKQKPEFLFFPTRDEVRRWDGGAPEGGRTMAWRGPPPGRAMTRCGPLAHLLTPPFHLYNPLDGKTLEDRSIFHETYYKPPPSSTRDREGPEALPGTLPEAFFITMGASGVMCELSTLDYGSIAVARWLSSPSCALCLDIVSCLSWSRSSLCNSTCCVCWDPMNIGTMSSWCAEYYLYVISILFMILHALRC